MKVTELKWTVLSEKLDEWKNFEDRIKDPKLGYSPKDMAELTRQWVSYRGQTLSRTGKETAIVLHHICLWYLPSGNLFILRICMHLPICCSERNDVLQGSS